MEYWILVRMLFETADTAWFFLFLPATYDVTSNSILTSF